MKNHAFIFSALFIAGALFPLPDVGKMDDKTFSVESPANEFPQWGNLQPGPYTVGYRTIRTKDLSRTYTIKDGKRIPRPIQIYLWYPAAKSDKPRMPFGDYFNDIGFDQSGYKDPEVLKNNVLTEFKNGPLFPSYNQALTPEIYSKVTGTLTACVRDAEPMSEKFPLVMHFPGSVNQSVLIEFLVSHGYVVASLPLIGTSPATYGRGDASKISPLSQMEDLQFAFRELSNEKFIDNTSVSMIGMFAQLGLALQMKDQLFKSLACLDCSLQSDELKTSPFYDPGKVTIPFLEILNSDQNKETTVTDSLQHLTRYEIDFKNFPHADFYPFKRIAKPENSTEDKNYEYISNLTLKFLNTTLKNDKQAEKELLTNLNIPASIATLSVHKATPPVPTENEFLTWLREGDIEKAKAAYAVHRGKIASRDPFFFQIVFLARDRAPHTWETIKMFVDSYPGHPRMLRYLNIYGYYFLNQCYDLSESKIAFQTMLRDYPESPYAHDAWADYLFEIGNTKEALDHSQKAIALTAASQLSSSERDGIGKSAQEKIRKINSLSKVVTPISKGEFTVGFKTIKSRTQTNDPMLISIWYPTSSGKSTMMLKDYISLDFVAEASGGSTPISDFKKIAERIYDRQISDSALAAVVNTGTNATQRAKPKTGKFPLVIASSEPAAYFELFETLAAHGYVVAAVTAQFSKPNPGGESPDHYTRYTNVLNELLVYMKRETFVDTTDISAFGHGGGIQSAMYLAMRSRSVKRVINLDGGFFGPRSKTINSRDYHPEKFSVPLLHIVTTSQNTEDDAEQFAAIKSPVTKVTLQSKAVRHHDFTAWRKLADVDRNSDEKRIVTQSLEEVNEAIIQFLRKDQIESKRTLWIETQKFNQ